MPGIRDWFRRSLAAPRFADPEMDRIARAAYTCAVIFIAVVLAWTVATWIAAYDRPLTLTIGGTSICSLGLVALLARLGFARASAGLFVAHVFTVSCVGTWAEGGLPITSMSTFIVFVVAASVFFSAAAAWGAAGLVVLTLLAFWRLSEAGMMPEPIVTDPPLVLISGFSMVAITVLLVQLNLARIRESEHFLKEITDATPHALYVFDLVEQKWAYGNRAAYQLLALEEATDTRGGSVNQQVHPDDLPLVSEYIHRLTHAGNDDVLEVEFRAQHRDGSWRTIRTQSKIFDRAPDGRVRQFLGMSEDVTAAREAQQALERSREQLRRAERLEALGQLAGGIAHDFNNYLTVIIGATDAAIHEIGGDRALLGELIEEANTAALHSAELTRQLLGFSRHRLTQPRTFQLNDLLRDSDRLLRRVIPSNIEIDMVPGQRLPPIHADPGQIEQIVVNLAVNARDAMPEGGRITIQTSVVEIDAEHARRHPDAREGAYVVLSVADTGMGMDADTRSQIFEPLFTTKGSGTGFGLATVDAIVRQTGGHLEVQSEPGNGTCFNVYLPCAEGEPSALVAAQEEPPSAGNERVMLVEDDPMVRNFTRRALESAGYRVAAFADGSDARRAFLEDPDQVDLLLTDIMMPVLSGLELAATLREERRDLPVVFMSGYTANVPTEKSLGPKEHVLHKPFSVTDLRRAIREALDAI